MTENETVTILKEIKVAFPKFEIPTTETERKIQHKFWQRLFQDEPFEIVEQAVNSLMCSLKFPPTVADIKERIHLLTTPIPMTEIEAWNLVSKAAANSSYSSKEEFEKLPAMCQQLVGSAAQLKEWGMMPVDKFNTVVQSNFMRSYKSMLIQNKEQEMLPESAKEMQKILGAERKEIE